MASKPFLATKNEKGVAERIRTSDFFLRREALYPLSYSNVSLSVEYNSRTTKRCQ